MKDVSEFGTDAAPLRCSALPLLVKCGWRATMLHLGIVDDSSGEAADTGTAVHAAVEHWHKSGDTRAALDSIRARLGEFPLADLNEARLHFEPYTLDPRNAPSRVRLIANELPVQFNLAPSDRDPTGRPIVVTGTLDQIRQGPDGRLCLWDLKTGRRDGWAMLHDYALQLAAYCVGARAKLGKEVHPGGIIRSRGWRTRGCDPTTEPPGVFFHSVFGVEDLDALLDAVREAVASIRSGTLNVGPGEHCSYCPSGGLQSCLPKLRNLCS